MSRSRFEKRTYGIFVFAADVHYGSAQSPAVVKKGLNAIKEAEPEFILLGGDITDEFTTKEEMQEIFRLADSLPDRGAQQF